VISIDPTLTNEVRRSPPTIDGEVVLCCFDFFTQTNHPLGIHTQHRNRLQSAQRAGEARRNA
jgi:hypothetical protein